MKSEADGRSSRLYLIRSYDHDKQTSPDISRGPTPRVTMRSGRTNTDISANTNTTLRRQERKKSLVYINYEKAQQLEVWQVARAATAAKFYFEPLKIENFRVGGSTEFTDGGFGQANNPTRTGTQEIEELHGYDSIGIVVSIGTARKLKEDAKKATFFSTIPGSAREFADAATDPEIIHHNMQRHHDKRHEFPYYRLNHAGGLQTELDEWEPKRKMYNKKDGGAKTIADMEGAFDKWAGNQENIQQLRECAAALVARRRERMSTRKWERYATGSHFECRVKGCDDGDFYYRDQFQSHLSERHGFEGDYLECQMRQRRKHWRYQVAPRHWKFLMSMQSMGGVFSLQRPDLLVFLVTPLGFFCFASSIFWSRKKLQFVDLRELRASHWLCACERHHTTTDEHIIILRPRQTKKLNLYNLWNAFYGI